MKNPDCKAINLVIQIFTSIATISQIIHISPRTYNSNKEDFIPDQLL